MTNRILFSAVLSLAVAACGSGTGGTSGNNGGNAAGGNNGGNNNGGNTSGNNGGNGGGPTPGASTLLVDNAQAATADALANYEALIYAEGISYQLVKVASDGTQSGNPGAVPSQTLLASVDTVIWYTGDNFDSNTGEDNPISGAQEALLTNWLDSGDKTLIIFSQGEGDIIDGTASGDFTTAPTDPLFSNTAATAYLPLNGAEYDPYVCVGTTCTDQDISGSNYVITGNYGSLQGTSWTVSTSPETLDASVMNPGAGVTALLNVSADPTSTGTANAATPICVGEKDVGAKGTSTVIWAGFPIENVVVSQQDLFHGILSFAGLP
jgi:hypothetical protein